MDVAVAGLPCVRACERVGDDARRRDATDVRLSPGRLASVMAGAGLRSASRDVEAASGAGNENEGQQQQQEAQPPEQQRQQVQQQQLGDTEVDQQRKGAALPVPVNGKELRNRNQIQRPDFYGVPVCHSAEVVGIIYSEAINGADGENWRAAMKEEMQALEACQTWIPSQLPPGRLWTFFQRN